ncbi:tetratricopeptide repeat protein [Anabaena cylindrica FACHB-243]|nr:MULTISPECIES: tetratricopeptide repeat protein [Anabaena]MBD2416136.1 tetratricopeptide repeat protein [Anabaena cylindrica FACHB-243]MBY5283578.1 tetratricopeptide repeat protein [Anabaena sp. CCAP 1446/1C]MBY5308053.1 tetratricopeptide repeat protein [Anabaena sp. CCAP 1446/1C]MCM2410058.1 tetratricopeptide repeat protein [Anabaena sp. CCAP 1446/1C]
MDSLSINSLLEDLKNSDANVRKQATRQIWRFWFQQKGVYGLEKIDHSQRLIDAGQLASAEELLTRLIQAQPDFAEAWNRRAFLYYSMGHYPKSLVDCQMVIQLNPVHFGAIHGMGLCYAAQGKYSEAIQAFQKALKIQPYSLVNQKLILECTLKLS